MDTCTVQCSRPSRIQSSTGLWGKRLDEIAREMGKPAGEALLDLIEQDHANSTQVIFVKNEADVRTIMSRTWVSLGIDSAAQAIDGPFAGFGTRPRAFGAAARLSGLLCSRFEAFPTRGSGSEDDFI